MMIQYSNQSTSQSSNAFFRRHQRIYLPNYWASSVRRISNGRLSYFIVLINLNFFNRMGNDIEFMTGSRPNIFWMLCWKYISPIAIFIVLIASIVQTSQETAKYKSYVGCVEVSVSWWHFPLSNIFACFSIRCTQPYLDCLFRLILSKYNSFLPFLVGIS